MVVIPGDTPPSERNEPDPLAQHHHHYVQSDGFSFKDFAAGSASFIMFRQKEGSLDGCWQRRHDSVVAIYP